MGRYASRILRIHHRVHRGAREIADATQEPIPAATATSRTPAAAISTSIDAVERDIADRAEEIRRWEAAYALVHDGEKPPASYIPPASYVSSASSLRDQPSQAKGFPVQAGVGVGLLVGGAALSLIGRAIYFSDPFYNNTTDPVGIALMVLGGATALIGLILGSRSIRTR
jgi:hypothetical protein